MTGHLSDDQIERLLHVIPQTPRGDDSATWDAQQHIGECEICRNEFEARKAAVELLRGLRSGTLHEPGSACPPEDVWLELAGGVPSPQRERLLQHASQCDHCAILFRSATEDLADNESAEETAALNTLASASDRWQREVARRIKRQAGSRRKHSERQTWWSGIVSGGSVRPMVVLGSVTILAIVAVFTNWIRYRSSPEVLVRTAYVERRTIPERIQGAPWVPLRQERGAAGDIQDTERLALVKAKAAILPELKRHPAEVYWLDQSARLYLIEDDPRSADEAVKLLEKAHNLDLDNVEVAIDLASAYLLNADLNAKESNIGSAIEILAELKNAGRGGEVALWNYAIAEERAEKWEGALSAWQDFVRQYPNSDWAKEAHGHVESDQQLIEERHKESELPLLNLEDVANAYASNNVTALEEVDRRIEEYQEVAIREWLPLAFSAGSRAAELNADRALKGLAGVLVVRHGDRWLEDVLTADRAAPSLREAIQLLSDSARTVETSDASDAERQARAAEATFVGTRLEAGALRARLTIVFASQYQHKDDVCRIGARQLLSDPAIRRYAWIAIQARIELAMCSPVADSLAVESVNSATRLARDCHFPILTARALAAQSGVLASLGDIDAAWSRASDALDLYWRGEVPPLRGYNALIGLYELNRPSNQWALQADLLKEAVRYVESDSRTLMVAVAYAQLGESLVRGGDPNAARAAYESAERLLAKSGGGNERDALWAEVELGLARVALDKSHIDESEDRLQRIRPILVGMKDSPLQIEFLQTSGAVLLRLNRLSESARDFGLALNVARNELRRIGPDEARWKTSRQDEDLYRSLAEVRLRTDSFAAFKTWESFKTDALQQQSSAPQISLPKDIRTVYLAYMETPQGFAVWEWDGSNLQEKQIAVDLRKLDSLTSRFLEECSEPDSEMSSLRRDGSLLYSEIVAPVAPWLALKPNVIIEPDGPLKRIPFAILVEPSGTYLGDHVNIAISPGLPYLARARHLDSFSANTTAFILANPKEPGWAPLPAAEEEGRAVAALFRHPQVIQNSEITSEQVANIASRSDVFHFAGHAYAGPDAVGIVVGDSARTSDSLLSAIRDGRTALVVLSACSSSSGRSGLFDDDSSMVRALLAARVQDVVASRWNVDSASTALLMKSFYSDLMNGNSAVGSLNQAMRAVRNIPGYEHPYYWGGFSMFGNI